MSEASTERCYVCVFSALAECHLHIKMSHSCRVSRQNQATDVYKTAHLNLTYIFVTRVVK